jgi:hypothetical protein
MNLAELLPLLVPLIVLQLLLVVVALRDLIQPDRRVRGGNKGIWAVIIVLGELLGPIVYFVAGREE